MAYTTINKSTDNFNTVLYTGNYTDNTNITGVGFQPDFVWLKERSSNSSHLLQDAVRGANKDLFSDLTSAEESNTNRLKAFISDGFTVGQHNLSNQNGETYVSWNWKAGGAGSTNYDGSITSTVSANTTAGFSIVSYTGNGTGGATVGHGLSSVPHMYIIKRRDTGGSNWHVYHKGIGATKGLRLNLSNAENTTDIWQDTAPTSSVFSLGSSIDVNASGGTYIGYIFSEKKGYSKFGSYTGNGNADGTFVYTGFKPAFVMHKRIDSTSEWFMFDNKRLGYNSENYRLMANHNSTEADPGEYDLLSNGFKLRFTSGNANGSGASYIYMAFAEAPLVGTNNIPCTAR